MGSWNSKCQSLLEIRQSQAELCLAKGDIELPFSSTEWCSESFVSFIFLPFHMWIQFPPYLMRRWGDLDVLFHTQQHLVLPWGQCRHLMPSDMTQPAQIFLLRGRCFYWKVRSPSMNRCLLGTEGVPSWSFWSGLAELVLEPKDIVHVTASPLRAGFCSHISHFIF